MQESEASRRTTLALRRIRALLASHVLDVKFAALKRAVKANFDPSQPRVPAGNPYGGQWTRIGGPGGDSTAASFPRGSSGGDASRDDRSDDLVVLASYTPGRGDNDEPPKVPKERPRTSHARTRVLKGLGFWLARQVVTRRVRALLTILDQADWLEPSVDIIRAFADSPKTLEDLHQDVSSREPGYDVHHIVEKSAALRDGFPLDIVNGPENLVRIPRLKHWLVTAWYQIPNKRYDWLTPREYLRGKHWEERRQVGLEILIELGVLKP